jgi:hypothetical protein
MRFDCKYKITCNRTRSQYRVGGARNTFGSGTIRRTPALIWSPRDLTVTVSWRWAYIQFGWRLKLYTNSTRRLRVVHAKHTFLYEEQYTAGQQESWSKRMTKPKFRVPHIYTILCLKTTLRQKLVSEVESELDTSVPFFGSFQSLSVWSFLCCLHMHF